MTEAIYDVGADVVAHQKQGNMHRLVHCCKPPQEVGQWTERGRVATVGRFLATWDGGVQGGELVRPQDR